jgi:DNA repair protein RecO (recombination protein O)
VTASRTLHEPAYVLHRYDWSESSLILEVFTRHHGRIALVAKGAKRPSSSFRPVLLPLQPLLLGFGGDGEIRTLKAAEWVGGHVMPTGDALLAGYYLNELLIRLLARDDPHAALFDGYTTCVQVLAGHASDIGLQPALRAFELLLLREIGFLPELRMETPTLTALSLEKAYSLVPEGGLLPLLAAEHGIQGAQWLQLEQALNTAAPLHAVLALNHATLSQLKTQLRNLLNYHCGVSTLRTRQMMVDLQAL